MKTFTVRNCVICFWELASPRSAGQASGLDTWVEADDTVLKLNSFSRKYSFCFYGLQLTGGGPPTLHISGNPLDLKSAGCWCEPRLQNTFTAQLDSCLIKSLSTRAWPCCPRKLSRVHGAERQETFSCQLPGLRQALWPLRRPCDHHPFGNKPVLNACLLPSRPVGVEETSEM